MDRRGEVASIFAEEEKVLRSVIVQNRHASEHEENAQLTELRFATPSAADRSVSLQERLHKGCPSQ